MIFRVVLVMLLFLVPFVNADLTEDIQLYYKLDELSGTQVADVTGNQNTGTANDSRMFTENQSISGKINTGASFVIDDDFITIPNNNISFDKFDNFSVSLWAKTYNNGQAQVFVTQDRQGGLTGIFGWQIVRLANNSVRFDIRNMGVATQSIISSNTIADNQFYHYVLVYNNQRLIAYIDGVLIGNISAPNGGGSPSTTNIGLGGPVANNPTTSFVNGFIDEFAIWDRPLSTTEVEFLNLIQKNGLTTGQYPFAENNVIFFNIYNATNNQLINYQTATVSNLNENGQTTKNTSNGIIPFILNSSFNNKLTITSAGFDQNEFTFSAGLAVPENTNIYLFEDSQLVTLSVRDTAFNNIENAYILVEAIVDGQFVNYSSKLTDVTGSAAFNLILDDNYRITVSAAGFETRIFNIEVTEQAYTLVLESTTGLVLDGPVIGVFYRYDPKDSVLRDEIINFTWRVFPDVNNLQYFSIELYNGTTLLQQNINTTNSGGLINISYNVSGFNNTYLTAVFRFKKEGFSEFSFPVLYYVDLGGDTAGSVIQARQYAQNNIPIEIRVGVWMIFAFIVMFVLAFYGVLGTKNVLFSLLISLFPAYFLAVTFLPVISIIGLIVISWVTDGGTQQ